MDALFQVWEEIPPGDQENAGFLHRGHTELSHIISFLCYLFSAINTIIYNIYHIKFYQD